MPIILLDPGHTKGYNRSPVNPLYAEGTRMWEFSLRLKDALEKKGFTVYTTRAKIEDDPSLYERGTMAGDMNADLFLSLHSNAPAQNPDGSYDSSKRGSISCISQADITFNRPLAEKLTECVAQLMEHDDLGSFYKDYPNRPGVDYYGVLRYAAASGCPHAIIMEHGFHTNMEDSIWLLDDKNLDLLAKGEAEVLYEYFKAEDPPQKLYRVQTGAYTKRENAIKMEKRLLDKGYDCFVSYSDGIYRVQAGAFYNLEYAKALAERLHEDGFETYIY